MHLADYMRDKGLSDEEVAKAIRRSRPTVSRIRRGKVRFPSEETLALLRRFSDGQITANDFLQDEAAE